MGKSDFSDWKKKLDRIENHLAEEVAPQVNKLLKESIRFSLVDYYNDYDPRRYNRTYNFMKISDGTRTSGKGNILTMTVHSGSMSTYPGFSDPPYPGYKRESLPPSMAFDFMFMGGEHGHGKWLMHKSLSPYMYVDEDIYSGFGGRVNSAINKVIGKMLS